VRKQEFSECRLFLNFFVKVGIWSMALKRGDFGQQIKNTWEVLKCGDGE